MEHFFKELSKKENGKLSFSSKNVASGIGVRSPYDVYNLQLNYKHHKIIIRNEIGVANIGSVFCKIPIYNNQSDFSIRTLSHFFKIFKKDKKSFVIECENANLIKFISSLSSINNLELLTLNTQFELSIYGEYINNGLEIKTEYNLIFENRENVLTELIQFYKDLINKLV